MPGVQQTRLLHVAAAAYCWSVCLHDDQYSGTVSVALSHFGRAAGLKWCSGSHALPAECVTKP